MTSVVTFDAGQTLVELDLDFLARRLGERGLSIAPIALQEAAPAAWRRYDAAIEAGDASPWKAFMAALLAGAAGPENRPGSGLALIDLPELVDWLWHEQPRKNLWRKPIADMIALARDLAARGVKVGVVSNSEGRLADLFVEVGIADPFAAIVDSGKLGIEKPDARIFAHALAALGAEDAAMRVHIGDSWPADVEGALAAGWHAVFFLSRTAAPRSDPRVACARDAAEVRAALEKWGV